MVYLMLPAKDEAPNLKALLPKASSLGFRAVVCDDGSTDGTAEVAESLGAVVIRHEANQGLAAALKTLIRYAVENLSDEDVLLFMDADNTMEPSEGLLLVRELEASGADIVIGSRFVPGGGVTGLSPFRQALSLGSSLFFRAVTQLPIRDYTSGFRAYRAAFIKRYAARFPHLFDSPGFAAQTELLLRGVVHLEARVREVPVRIRYEAKEGASKMRVARTVREYLLLGLRTLGWRLERAWGAGAAG